MLFLKDELQKRDLPPLLQMRDGSPVIPGTWRKRRKELLDILSENIYGRTPPAPPEVRSEIDKGTRHDDFAGKITARKIILAFDTPSGEFKFPFYLFIPKAVKNPPVFLHIAFRPDIPDQYTPVEEITDNGFALALVCYHDITPDTHDGDFTQGLMGMYYTGERKPNEWGKIGTWAYAASRILDYLYACGEVNADRTAVIGHSRLGKTALWTAAQDERFFMAVSNNSGFGGAAIAKRGSGERIVDFKRAGSWDWFCETFKTYDGIEDENTVYDQHMLLAAIAPRAICVGSAEIDRGADPQSEFLSCLVASEVYDLLGHYGLVTPDEYPVPHTVLHGGKIGYHIRPGYHFFSRTDWLEYMKFFKGQI